MPEREIFARINIIRNEKKSMCVRTSMLRFVHVCTRASALCGSSACVTFQRHFRKMKQIALPVSNVAKGSICYALSWELPQVRNYPNKHLSSAVTWR